MGETTKIAWADSTFNPWVGCQAVSPGCDHCYPEAHFDKRLKFVEWGPHGERRRTTPDYWRGPIRWNAAAAKFQREHGHRQRVFCASSSDWLDNQVPPEWRTDLLALIEATPNLDWQLLTKRPELARKLVPDEWWGRDNVWFGISAEDQAYYDRRWPIAAKIPARVHFVSYEPALGPLDIRRTGPPHPDWVIAGSESGRGARPCDLEWVRAIRDQCASLNVSFFWKQWVENGRKTELPRLDGRIWADFPHSPSAEATL
jgi:protein gp37